MGLYPAYILAFAEIVWLLKIVGIHDYNIDGVLKIGGFVLVGGMPLIIALIALVVKREQTER